MAANLTEGAALGSVCNLLVAAVLEVTQKVATFKFSLDRLKTTLNSIKPIFDDIERLNEILNRPEEETESFLTQLRKAEKLVRKCLEIKSWNFYKKYTYSRKLNALDQSLLRFFKLDAQLHMVRDSRRIMVGMRGMDDKVDEILSFLSHRFPGWCDVPGFPEFVVGLDAPLEELKLMLLKDGVSVLVLSAPGGCGKTTLAKMLCHDPQIRDRFRDNIFFVNVARTPNLMLIVQKIFRSKNKHQVPEFQSDEDAINQFESLLKRLKPHPSLLVLDDVWRGSEFLIERFRISQPGFKVLVTSRSVFRSFETTFRLKLLNDENAKTLFCHSAFKDGIPDVQNDLVDKVVKGCGGFPLALKVIGQSLRGEPEAKWIHRTQKWSEGVSVFNPHCDVLNCLKSSLDALTEIPELPDLKECYLDLGSFPEDQRIPATALLDVWVELYNLDEEDVHTLVHLLELSDRNLINLVLQSEDGHFAMQHDLLRDLVVYQNALDPIEQRTRMIVEINENSFPDWWTKGDQPSLHPRLLSITTDELFASKWHDLRQPEAEVLVLNFQTRIYALPHFMERMSNLKVLIVTNYGFHQAELKDFDLIGHVLNLKRIRLERVSIPCIGIPMLQLKNLRKISLVMCDIEKAFENCSFRAPSIWPNLVEMNIDYCSDLIAFPVGLCNLASLEKLSITYCQELIALPQEIGNLTKLKALRLYSCTKLSSLPGSIGGLKKLKYLDLSDCLELAHLPDEIGKLEALGTIHMKGCGELRGLPPSVRDLGQLEKVICDEEVSYFWRSHAECLKKMNITVIRREANLNWLHRFDP
ncbi:probable disease resistance protein At5g66900 [Coffea eugenioides]|uniref:probable disease resistance protein At5g66900 n=1 Tax=Coffea eugenioides TaxID=49369 RepID=UPI000F60BD8D|nr:probable disease resistance protein At5g66900 [Coffea eugenioides]